MMMRQDVKWKLTVLSVQQDFEAVGLIVVERLPDFVDGLLVRQLSVHKTRRYEKNNSDQYWPDLFTFIPVLQYIVLSYHKVTIKFYVDFL